MRRQLILPAIAACAAIALPATADAVKLPTGKDTWQVSVKGKQTTTWSVHHTPDGTLSCDAPQSGSGSETVRFTSKPAQATSFTGGSLKMLMGRKGTLSVDATGSVDRKGSIQTGSVPNPEECPDGVGGGDPAPDCGAKPITHLFLNPNWDSRGRRLQLEQDTVVPLTPNYKHCPVTGEAWPSILDASQAFPFRELSESGKHIVIGTAKRSGSSADSDWKTTIRWEITLKRIKSERF